MVSDNATIFTSEEFMAFCKSSGIFQKFIAPGHPSTNGLAERNIQTLKKRLNAMRNEPGSIREKVLEILFRYRATPLIDGKTPSEKYLNRQIRIHLDALKPVKFQKTKSNGKSKQFSEGERVQAKYYSDNKQQWKLGTIIKKFGFLHYLVKLDNGYVFKRHVNQLIRTYVPEKQNIPISEPEADHYSEQERDPGSTSNQSQLTDFQESLRHLTYIPRSNSLPQPVPKPPLRSALSSASRPKRTIKRPVRFLI